MTDLGTIGAILGSMALVGLVESALPLHGRGRWNRVHLVPNLALTLLTFATNLLLGGGLVFGLARLRAAGVGLLPWLGLPPLPAAVTALLVLDFSFYVAHVCMHRYASLWRYHRVHHSDPAVDVTTTIRQHPGETMIRYAFLAAFALPLAATPAVFALYRAWAALNGLLEHADIRVPVWLDRLLSLVTTWPGVHKVHHSRAAAETNTNYGNIFSFFDRLFSTFTPASQGRNVVYGLDRFHEPPMQTTAGLLAMPFREPPTAVGLTPLRA